MTTTSTNTVLILGDNQVQFDTQKLRETIIELYDKGYRDFYTPLSSEFERTAAEIIFSLNVFKIDNKYPDMNLKVVVEHFKDHLRSATPEESSRFANILDSAHEVILSRSTKYATQCFNATASAFRESSLLLTCVDPNDMEITCQGDEDMQIEDFPMFLTYNLAVGQQIPIVNIFL